MIFPTRSEGSDTFVVHDLILLRWKRGQYMFPKICEMLKLCKTAEVVEGGSEMI